MKNRINHTDGFTIVELLIVIVVIAVLTLISATVYSGVQQQAYYSRAKQELNMMSRAVELYNLEYGTYPDDVDRDVPPGIEEFIDIPPDEIWPKAPWPGSVYDYDLFEYDGEEVVQISIRFCEIGQPETCNFPSFDWAEDFDVNSSMYWCINGSCKAHPAMSPDYPGYCVNCTN